MPDEKPDEIAIFAAASELIHDEQAAFLDEACQGDEGLRDRIVGYLRCEQQTGPLDVSPAALEASVQQAIATDHIGSEIGPYKLREQIGEGGMGVVYVAEQKEPVRRKVALKIIKPGMDTKQVIARFEAERQALALMDHPNVAKILDAGVTDTGRPYFVMELVQGLPITEYCDRKRLDTRERLELFILVCRSVQHAHQKGIIHRDLKPSNVLVAQIDAAAVPKVIDFGVAKAIGQKLTEQTIYTQFSQMIGTPLYMSPEQAEMGIVDVDTRSDVYSLGVLLYELLTGSTPFEKETLKEAGYDEMRRIIREEEPPRPSTRISTLQSEALSTLSAQRNIDAHKFRQQVQGELDWIAMRALEKDPTRRYESASAFAADVERFLADEPVEACPPSAMYRLKKYTRRNKATLVTLILVATSLLVGTAVSLWQAKEANDARDLANDRLESQKKAKEEADEQRQLAERNYTKAREAVQQMLTRVADESLVMIPEMKEIRQALLKDAVAFYTELLKLNPRDPVAYLERGRVYYMLMKYDKVRADYIKAVELDPDNADLHHNLAEFDGFCPDSTFRNNKSALLHLKWAIRLVPQKNDYHKAIALLYTILGEKDKARAEYLLAAELCPDAGWANIYLAHACALTGDLQGALQYTKKAIEADPLESLYFQNDLSKWHLRLGNYAEALIAATRAIEGRRRIRSESADASAFYSYRTRAEVYVALKMYPEALADYDKVIELAPINAKPYIRRALVLFHLKQYDKALAEFEKIIELDSDNANTCNNAAWFIVRYPGMKTEFIQRAVQWAKKAVELEPKTGGHRNTLGVAQYRAGNWPEAIDALKKSEELLNDDHYSFNGFFLSMAHRQLGDQNTAHEWYKKSVVWMQENMPDNDELTRFRAEAEVLLGIPAVAKKPKQNQKKTGSSD